MTSRHQYGPPDVAALRARKVKVLTADKPVIEIEVPMPEVLVRQFTNAAWAAHYRAQREAAIADA